MQNMYYSPFQILIKLRFKGNFDRALQWVSGKEIAKNNKIPYMRIGVDYYKVIYKIDRYGINRRILKAWKKEEIKQDYGKEFLKEIPRYDDFVLVPDNINHQTIINNCFNMYAPFPYEPAPGQTKWSDILMEHIFGEQLEQGYQYMKALYENPDKILPILAIVSQQRETGKTTYLNWLSMIFGDNSITVESESLLKSHNSEYADKNLILIEEAKVDKSTATEKLKRLSTQKELTVDPKFVQPYKLPCYFKIVILSNDEDKFAKVDDEEIRFFVRKVGDIKHRNTDIESDLLKEIPAFLDKLAKMPALDFTKSRMLFTAEELNNESLQKVKKESKPELYKELFEYFTNIFEDSRDQDMKYFFVRPKEIKEYWFKSMSNITASYIRKILINEFKFNITSKNRRHEAFTDKSGELNGKPFVIPKSFFIDDNDEVKDMNEAPDVYVQDNELPF